MPASGTQRPRAASKHAAAWVCPPASFPWPPLGSDSLSSVPLPPPGSRSCAPTPGGAPGPQAGGGGWGQSGATRRRDRSPPAGRPAGVHVDAVDVVVADGYGPLWGLPHIEAAHRAAITTATPRRRAGSCVSGSSELLSAGHGGPRSVGAPEIERFAGLSAAAGRCESPTITDPFWNTFSNQNVHHRGASEDRQYIDIPKTLAGTSSDIPGDWIYRSNPKNWISNRGSVIRNWEVSGKPWLVCGNVKPDDHAVGYGCRPFR